MSAPGADANEGAVAAAAVAAQAPATGTPWQEHRELVEIDTSDDGDSAYGENDSTFTASVTSSILEFRHENGRRYHAYKEGSYFFPNDEMENDRLDLQHAVFLKSLGGKLCLAPIDKDAQHVLDIGTGTGIWALDFADEYPSAQVIGTDLSPIQPSFIPPNLKFLIDDAEADWIFSQKFDLIHGRMLVGSLQNWDRFFKQCYDNCKPGGWVELQDIELPLLCDDDTMPPKSPLYQWGELIVKAGEALDRPLDVALKHKRRMEKAGFVDVVDVVHKWPENPWAKDPHLKQIGLWTMMNMLQGVQGLTMAPLTRGLGWTAQEVEVFLIGVREDVKNRGVHCYWPIHFVYGRKPGGDDK